MATNENRTRWLEALKAIEEKTLKNKQVSEVMLQEFRKAFRSLHNNVPYQNLLSNGHQIMTDILKRYNTLICKSRKFDMYIVTSQMLNDLERRLVDFLKEYLTTIADRDKVTLWNLYHYLNETGRNTLDETASCKMAFDYIKKQARNYH